MVFAYTVGDALVLEQAALERAGDATLFTRTFNVIKAGAGASVKVADAPDGAEIKLEGGRATIAKDDAKNPDGITVAAVSGAPMGAQLAIDGRHGFFAAAAHRGRSVQDRVCARQGGGS